RVLFRSSPPSKLMLPVLAVNTSFEGGDGAFFSWASEPVRAINENRIEYANRFLMVHIIGLQGLVLWLAAASPEQRAADYLAREVAAWERDNHCYSCHNNGDGARALFAARRAGLTV